MESQKQNQIIDIEEARKALSVLYKVFIRRKVAGAIAVSISAAILTTTSIVLGYEYSASISILPYRSGGKDLGGLLEVAGAAGIRLPTGGDQTILSDVYPDIIQSSRLIGALAKTPLRFNQIEANISLEECYLNELKLKWYITVASSQCGQIRKKTRTDNEAENKTLDFTSKDSTTARDRALSTIRKNLTTKINKRTSLIQITANLNDPQAATDLATAATNLLTKTLAEIESQKTSEELAFANRELTVARERHIKAQEQLALYDDSNRTISTKFPTQRRSQLENEASLAYDIYSLLRKEVEMGKIKRNQSLPTFAVIDQSNYPRKKRKLPLSLVALLSFGSAAALIIAKELVDKHDNTEAARNKRQNRQEVS